MSDLETFKKDVQACIAEHLPEHLRFGNRPGLPEDDVNKWFAALVERGWVTPNWPTEYGGGGLDRAHTAALRAELRAVKAPTPSHPGISMIGPVLLDIGTEEQKRQHLPKISRNETYWCQGFSEPGAGSDLASLQTRAELNGDEYVVNGSKIWTSGAHKADWVFCLVRTDPDVPKHAGISMLLIEMRQPGIDVSPLKLIDGTAEFNQVFFDNAKAGANQIVGELHGGWDVSRRILQYERSTDIHDVIIFEAKETIVELLQREIGMEGDRLADASLRERLAAHQIDARALDLTMRRAGEEVKAGQQRRDVSSIGKYRWGDVMKEENDLAMLAAGLDGLGWEGEGFLPTQLAWTRDWLFSRSHSIWGGTHEIQKNVIAKRVLDIPEN